MGKIVSALVCFFFPILLCMGQTHGLMILADATGNDSHAVSDFWGVAFLDGSDYVKSVTFDLSMTDRLLMFDFDLIGGGPTEPIITVDVWIGHFDYITSDEVTPGQPRILTFLFLPDSFGVGDSFRFQADYDGWTPSDGGSVGSHGGIFRVELYGGETFSAPFVQTSEIRSEAFISIPEPSTLLLLGVGLIGLGVLRRRLRTSR